MKTDIHPKATTAPFTVHIASGQILWVCLPPGSVLHTTQGEITILSAPCSYGYAVHSPPRAVLKAGAQLPLPRHDRATWMQLSSTTDGPAEIKIVESMPEAGLRQKAWALLRTIFAGRKKEQPDGAYGALHAAR
ncbi:hypothetical protein [Acidovorax radicis]|uniref:hypothetical protein n=1 Tax=Acidovorax radicis TaxID=758826 RepID=UPI00023758AD|nr:hypothetical protein [Acidovorax radicis]